jgi:hypothetical protein
LIGGVGDLVREKLKAEGHYDEFIRIAEVSSKMDIASHESKY